MNPIPPEILKLLMQAGLLGKPPTPPPGGLLTKDPKKKGYPLPAGETTIGVRG